MYNIIQYNIFWLAWSTCSHRVHSEEGRLKITYIIYVVFFRDLHFVNIGLFLAMTLKHNNRSCFVFCGVDANFNDILYCN